MTKQNVRPAIHTLEQRRLLVATSELIQDMQLAPVDPSSLAVPNVEAVGNGLVLFTADDGVHGTEPWVTDGTQAGTRMLLDVAPGSSSSSTQILASFGKLALFTTRSNGVSSLFRSDGTAAGTVVIGTSTENVIPTSIAGNVAFVAVNGRAYRIDGSSPANVVTQQVMATSADGIAVAGDKVFFRRRDDGLYVGPSDGSAMATRLVPTGVTYRSISNLIAVGGKAYFVSANWPGGEQAASDGVWTSDGTVAGTRMVGSLWQGPLPRNSAGMFEYGGDIYYFVSDTSHRLYRRTAAGVNELVMSSNGFYPSLNVKATTYRGRMLLTSWGPYEATQRVVVNLNAGGGMTKLPDALYMSPSEPSGVQVGENLHFAQNFGFTTDPPSRESNLLVSDGTLGGTRPLIDVSVYAGQFGTVSSVEVVGDTLYYSVSNPSRVGHLWRYDLQTGEFGPVASVSPFTKGHGALAHPLPAGGAVIDGPKPLYVDAAGHPTGHLTFPAGTHFVEVDAVLPNGTVIYRAARSITSSSQQVTLFAGRADTAQTPLVELTRVTAGLSDIGKPVIREGRAYYQSLTSIWQTDGTVAGTSVVATFPLGSNNNSDRRPAIFDVRGGRVFFSSSARLGGTAFVRELFFSNGAGGATLFADFTPGVNDSSSPVAIASHAGGFYFSAFSPDTGRELYFSDGTVNGTKLVADLEPGPGSGFVADLRTSELVGDTLYFLGRTTATGREIFKTNGDPSSTQLVSDLVPGIGEADYYASFMSLGDRLLYIANPGAEASFYATDGTDAGTTRLDLPEGLNLTGFVVAAQDGAAYFAGLVTERLVDGTRVTLSRLWRTDGNTIVPLAQMYDSPASTLPTQIAVLPETLIVNFEDPVVGREPHRIANPDGIAPRLAQSEYRVDARTPYVSMRFTEAVAPGNGSVRLRNLTTGADVDPNRYTTTFNDSTIEVRPSTLLNDGWYGLTLEQGAIVDQGANAASEYVVQFHVLAGDANRDKTVDFKDLVILAQNYQQTGRSFTAGNFDYSSDGLVSFADLVILAQRYNVTLSLPALVVTGETMIGTTDRRRKNKLPLLLND